MDVDVCTLFFVLSTLFFDLRDGKVQRTKYKEQSTKY